MSKSVPFPQAIRSWMDVAMHRSMRGWSHHAKSLGLSMPQFSILMQLHHRGTCGISDISERFEISAAAASQHVDSLVQAGLIERTEDLRDRRAKHLQLSARARTLIQQGMSQRYRWMDQLAQVLDETDREKIAGALTMLTEAARKLDQAP